MMMDEILGSKDPSADHPDQTGSESDLRNESPSQERVETPGSQGLSETPMDVRPRNSSDESIENDARPTPVSEANSDNGDSESLGNQFPLFQSVSELSYESSFSCKYPGCTFTSVDAEIYLKHEDSHVDGGSVSCDSCKVTFPTYASMRRHHLYIHQGIRTFECSQCSKRFLRKDQFLDHQQQQHLSMPRAFQCAFCGSCFSQCNQLQSHLNSFHGFHRTCVFCQFKALSPDALKVHYSTFHDVANRAPVTVSESGAIDLAKVSQTFILSSFSAASGSKTSAKPGPSDFSQASKGLRLLSPLHSTRNLSSEAVKPSSSVVEDPSQARVSSASGSTVSTFMTSQGSTSKSAAVVTRGRVQIKPEPPELIVEDSQNSSVQPTSTMDFPNCAAFVESTCIEGAGPFSSGTTLLLKVHKRSSTEDTGSESRYSPPVLKAIHIPASQAPTQSTMKTPHTCRRVRPYDESGSSASRRCREHSRHTCTPHKLTSDRRLRYSDSDIDGSAQNDQSDGEERKVFDNQATSTNSSSPRETEASRGPVISTHAASEEEEAQRVSNFYNHKNTIVIHGIESCALTCVYCGIVFPDQTLYLLHRSLHSEASPWKCNLCGKTCKDKYDFNSHVISKGHH